MVPDMRQNFDYVTMTDYRADMVESADHAIAAIELVKQKEKDAKRALVAAVLSAGGKLTIHSGALMDAEFATLTIWRNEADDTIILQAERRSR